jgi:hypothetical protein
MKTTIKEILKKHIPSNEIKQRFNNKQIKFNTLVVTDLNQELEIHEDFSTDLGEFVFKHIDKLKNINVLGNVKDFFGDFDTNVKKFKFLGAYDLLEFSKKESVVLLRKPSTELEVTDFSVKDEEILKQKLNTDLFIGVSDELFYYLVALESLS